MSNQGRSLRGAAVPAGCLFCASVILWGCKGVPPVPPHAARRANPDVHTSYVDPDNDEYSGRLFRTGSYREQPKRRSLRRSGEAAAPTATQPAMPSGPAHAPAPYPPQGYPSPPPPPGYQQGPQLAPPYAQQVPGQMQPAYPYGPNAAPGTPLPGNGTPQYAPAQGYPPGTQPTPKYPEPQPNPSSRPYPAPQPYPIPQPYPAPQPYPSANPYTTSGQAPAGGGQVIPTSATAAIPPGDPVATGASASSAEPEPEPRKPIEDDGDGFELSDLSPNNIAKTVKEATGRGPDENLARQRLEEGRALFAEKKYAEAAEKLKEAADRWPDSPLAEDALFFRAECLFFTDQYPAAQDTYGKLLKDYKNSRYLDTVTRRLFAIGRYWDELNLRESHWPITPNFTDRTRPRFDTFGRALKAYESIRIEDPTGPLADDSLMAIGVAYYNRERYEDAAVFFDLVRTEYPESDHQPKAHVLALRSKLRSYQGEHYDATPLKQAEEIADQTLAQFRRELGPEAEQVLQSRARIEQQKAARDWAVAQFYDNKHQYGAARIYYRSIVEEYPGTRFAEMAERRMEELRGEPAEPPERYAWLTKAFEPLDEAEVQRAEAAAPVRWARSTIRALARDESDPAEVR